MSPRVPGRSQVLLKARGSADELTKEEWGVITDMCDGIFSAVAHVNPARETTGIFCHLCFTKLIFFLLHHAKASAKMFYL